MKWSTFVGLALFSCGCVAPGPKPVDSWPRDVVAALRLANSEVERLAGIDTERSRISITPHDFGWAISYMPVNMPPGGDVTVEVTPSGRLRLLSHY